MELADAADAVAINAGLQNYFVYYEWMVNENVPTDVTFVIIHSSVRAIKKMAFCDRTQLRTVIFNELLEEIDEWTFAGCILLEEIVVPNNVRTIGEMAFNHCQALRRVTFGDRLVAWLGIPPEFCRNSAEFRIPVVFLSRFFRFRFRFRSEKKVPAFFFFFFTMTEPIPAINFRVFSAGKFRNSVFGSGIPDSGSPRNRNPKSEFPTKGQR
jgi:hypothetical protein